MADSISSFTAANKAAWNASASLHGQGAEWDSLLDQASRPGFSVLDEELTKTILALGLEGVPLGQVQVHGQDADVHVVNPPDLPRVPDQVAQP